MKYYITTSKECLVLDKVSNNFVVDNIASVIQNKNSMSEDLKTMLIIAFNNGYNLKFYIIDEALSDAEQDNVLKSLGVDLTKEKFIEYAGWYFDDSIIENKGIKVLDWEEPLNIRNLG